MLLSLAACGEKTPATNDENANPSSQQTEDPGQQEQTQPDSKQNEKADVLTTVEGFMRAFGVTEDDMKCANFTRIDKTSYDIDSGKIIEIGSYQYKGKNVAMADEQYFYHIYDLPRKSLKHLIY